MKKEPNWILISIVFLSGLVSIIIILIIFMMFFASSTKNKAETQAVYEDEYTKELENSNKHLTVGFDTCCEDCDLAFKYVADMRTNVCVLIIEKNLTGEVVEILRVECNKTIFSYASHTMY